MLHSKLLWRIKFFCTGCVKDKEKTLVRGKNVDSIPCVKLLVTALLLHINLAPQGLLTRETQHPECQQEKLMTIMVFPPKDASIAPEA